MAPLKANRSRKVAENSFLGETDMSKIKVSVSVDDAHVDRLTEVSMGLQSMGMDVEQILQSIGIISGSVSSDQVNSLYQIEGVQHIESERSYQLAPPDADVQ
jgi:hypothetical protein